MFEWTREGPTEYGESSGKMHKYMKVRVLCFFLVRRKRCVVMQLKGGV